MRPSVQPATDLFTYRQDGKLGILELRSDLFAIATDLDAKEDLFTQLSRIDRDPDTEILLVVNQPGTLDEEAYSHFLENLFSADGPIDPALNRSDLEKEQLLSREEYGLSQLITRIHFCSKITAIGLQGHIAPPFLGMALAFDFRLAAEDVLFALSFSQFGVPPSGGLGFFLPRFVGQGRAMEIALSGRPLPVREARALGLINEVLPVDLFAERCREKAVDLIDVTPDIAGYTKSLLVPYPEEELARYLEKECEVVRSAWRRHVVQLQQQI